MLPTVGVVIGRFQVDDLTEGHRILLDWVAERHSMVIVFVGEAPTRPNARNPMPAYLRIPMLQRYLPRAVVLPLVDMRSNVAWSKRIDQLIDATFPQLPAILYGGRDSFIPYYAGRHKTQFVDAVPSEGLSGTAYRARVAREWSDSPEFRRGVIHGSTIWPLGQVYPTVDIGMVRERDVLLVRKPDEDRWRFPGGFVDVQDESLEAAAKRELFEETGLSVEGRLRFLGSARINDWRLRGSADRGIMSSFFSALYTFGAAKGLDDVADARWFPIAVRTLDESVIEEHQIFFSMLLADDMNRTIALAE